MKAIFRMSLLTLSVVMGSAGLMNSQAQAYPLNPWGAAIPEKTIAINPFLYLDAGPNVYPIFYAGYGISERFDVWAGAGAVVALNPVSAGWGALEVFPRFFIIPELALAAHVYYSPGSSLTLAPEVHFNKTWGNFALTINAGHRSTRDQVTGTFSHGTIAAIVAPEYYLSKRLSLFLEVDPILTFQEGVQASAILAPGVWFALDEDQKHSFALAVQLPVPFDANAISGGIWYSTTFGPL